MGQEVHSLRLEASEAAAAQRRYQEAEVAAAAAPEEVLMQLEAAQREARVVQARECSATGARGDPHAQQLVHTPSPARALRLVLSQARAESSTQELSTRLRHQKRLWAKEKAALKQAEAARSRMVEALRHELERLRAEREGLPPAPSLLAAAATCAESCAATSSSAAAAGSGVSLPAELQRLARRA